MSSRFLALDMAKRGIRQPLIITQDGVVVSGHRRLAAARLAGIAEVPCVVQDDADDAKMAVEMTLDNAPRKRPFTQLMAHALVLKDIVEPILAARKRHQDPSGLPGYASIAPIIEMMAGGSASKDTVLREGGTASKDAVLDHGGSASNDAVLREGGCVNKITQPTEGSCVNKITQLDRVRWEDVVGKLIGIGGRALRWGMEIYLAALEGDERAADLCVKLDEGELTIGAAYKAFKADGKPSAARYFVVLRRYGNMRSRLQHTEPRPRHRHRCHGTPRLGVRIVLRPHPATGAFGGSIA